MIPNETTTIRAIVSTIRRWIACSALFLGIASQSLGAQAPSEPEPASTYDQLETFDRELKAALAKQDVTALALLVHFPLRLNYDDGSATSLDNPRALQVHFAEAFPPAVRRAVATTKGIGDMIRRSAEIGYGNGELWLRESSPGGGERFQVAVINLPGASNAHAGAIAWKLAFVCNTLRHRIVVDVDPKDRERVRYRSWDRPLSPAAKPSLEALGTFTMEGTGGCIRTLWKVSAGKALIAVGDLGCTGSEVEDATGELTVTIAGEVRERSWCR